MLEKYKIRLRRVSLDKKKNNSGFRLIDICKINNLSILNGRYGHDKNTGAMTFRDTSVIDYVLVSAKAFEILHDFQITDVDRLFSDGHSLLSVTVSTKHDKTPCQAVINETAHTSYLRPNEYECFVDNIDRAKVNQILNTLQTCDNSSPPDIVNEIALQICDTFQQSAAKIECSRVKNRPSKNPENRPWFGFQCKNARKKYHLAKRKHNACKSIVNKSALVSASRIYKKTMNKFMNKYNTTQQNKLRNMQKCQPKEYWKFLNSLKNKGKSEMPPLNKFFEYFKNVFSSEYENEVNDMDLSDINFENSTECLNCPFTSHEIDRCINKLKNSKSPGRDEILNEYIKITKDLMLPVYVSFFNLILNTGHLPDDWLIGKIKPIYKNKGDSLDPNNYRPITLLSCLGKLFTAVLNERLNNFLEENDLLNENQAGFRKHHSTTDHIFTLYALIELMKYEKKKLFCCFVDFSKAFDSVWRIGLWRKLINTHVNGKFLRVLQNMYLDIKSCVTIRGDDSPFFSSNRGVRQGDNISPVMFSLFLNDLEDHLISDRINGIPIECADEQLFFYIKIFILLYADDTVILSDNEEDFQNSLHSFASYCKEWKLEINETKTKIIIFGARKTNTFSFKLENHTLEIVDSYKYLGTFFLNPEAF